MRLIDADELLKWISGQSKSPSCPKNESAFGLRIMKHIDHMPSVQPEVLACGSGELNVQSEPQWIPCSERLPEHGGWYIVTKNLTDDGDKAVCLTWYSFHGWEWAKLLSHGCHCLNRSGKKGRTNEESYD